jgi:poly(A) polymerase
MFEFKRRLDMTLFIPVPDGYLVGGAVRDVLLKRDVSDFDWLVAEPEQIAREVADSLGGSVFALDEGRGFWRVVIGTVTRDYLRLDTDLESNLRERDFTINATAAQPDGTVIDPLNGQADLKAKTLRMVSQKNMYADPLRSLRAVRFAAVLGFKLEPETLQTCKDVTAAQFKAEVALPAWERIAEELDKIIFAERAAYGFKLLAQLGMLELYLPEIAMMQGVEQGGFHHLDVFDHSLEALHQLVQGFPESEAALRWATLLHDVGKPSTKIYDDTQRYYHFYGHDKQGANIAKTILERLKCSNQIIEKTCGLISYHMLPLPKSDKEARRFVHRRRALLPDLLKLMIADREAARGRLSSEASRQAYRLALARVLGILEEPPATPPLMTGRDVMTLLGISEGPRVGEAVRFIQEAQAVGDANNIEEAQALLKNYALRQGWTEARKLEG